MMNLGSVGMTKKQKPSLHGGRLWSFRGQKDTPIWRKVKVTLTVFFDHKGIIHHEYAPYGQTVNKEYYVKVLCQLCDAVRYQIPASCSKVTGNCTTKMLQPTHPTFSRNSWLNISSHKCRSPCIHQTWPCVNFSIPKGENAVEGE
jgi:hypothetical protein